MSIERAQKGHSLLTFNNSYVAIDLETTGLDPLWDDIIEVAAVRFDDGILTDSFQSLINPKREVDEFITELTGITNEMLSSAPNIETILPKYIDFIGESIVVGHNVNFDINFLYDACSELGLQSFSNDFIDTMRFSRCLFKGESHHRLIDLINRFHITGSVEHRALSDTIHSQQCYEYMKKYMTENDIKIEFIKPNVLHAKNLYTTNYVFDDKSPILGKTFVFTGTLEKMIRKDAMQLVLDNGGLCGDGVNLSTNYLVLGNNDYCTTIKEGKSNKQKKAERLHLSGIDIEIISENVFYNMLTDMKIEI